MTILPASYDTWRLASPPGGPPFDAHCDSCQCECYIEYLVEMCHPTHGDLLYCQECAKAYCYLCGRGIEEVWDAGKELQREGRTIQCKGGCPATETNEQGGETVAQMTETPVTDTITNLVEAMKVREDAEIAVLYAAGDMMRGLLTLLTVALGGTLPEKAEVAALASLGPDPADPEALATGREEGSEA